MIEARGLVKRYRSTLAVDRLTTAKLRDVSFELCRSEVLGIAGLVGSGRSELGAALFGLDRIRAGQFQYRTLDDQGQLTDWFSDWPDPSITPLMVRLSLDMQPGVEIPWPELDVPLVLNAGAVSPNSKFIAMPAGPSLRKGRQQ